MKYNLKTCHSFYQSSCLGSILLLCIQNHIGVICQIPTLQKLINAISILYGLFKFYSLKPIIFTNFGIITRIVKDILNNCSLEINTIQGLKVKKIHEYSNSIGKFVCRLRGWP